MPKTLTSVVLLLVLVAPFLAFAQNKPEGVWEGGGEYVIPTNSAADPCITPQQYEWLEKRCAANIKSLQLAETGKNRSLVLLNWPLQATADFTDCDYYGISAHVDHIVATGVISDYHCGTNTYDGHKGTDIFIWPFPLYKMENDQVEVIAAASGTLIDKADGNFDRNCGVSSLPANYVIIQHADGSTALYWHMKSGSLTTKAIGQVVETGEYLGVVGSSGNSSGPHLHFEIWSGSTSDTYNDPYSDSCNVLNPDSWWTSQKPYTEPAILKASVHTTDLVLPPCPTTEQLNEATAFVLPFQGEGLAPGYAKFYIFLRDAPIGSTVDLKILNPDGTTLNGWTYTPSEVYKASYWGWSKKLPEIEGTYTFQATYFNEMCSQSFDIEISTGIGMITGFGQLQLFPNPSNGTFNIVGDGIDNGIVKFDLKDVMGHLVCSDQFKIENKSVRKTISVSAWPNGLYFLTIYNEKAEIVKAIYKQDE